MDIMDLRSVYVANGVGIVILILLFYVSRAKVVGKRMEDRLLTFMVFGIMLGCFMEMLSYTLDGRVFPGARLLNYIANTYLFSVNLLLPFSLLVYIDLGLYGDPGRIRKKYRIQIVIGVIMFAANILNFFVPISYVITVQNVYERRPFSYVYYIVILYYCITAFFLTRRYEKEKGAKAFFNINMFLFPVLLGAGLQFLFYGLSLAWISAAVGLAGLFMMQQNEMSYIDALTDTYNRQYFNHILSAWIKRGNGVAGVMLDVDDFKRINDACGHSEGDKALTALAEILKRACSAQEWVFRFAGDEFIILKLTRDPNGLAACMDEIDRRLEAYNSENHACRLSLSWGASYLDSDDIDAFMKEMDDRMYEMKARHHGGGAAPCDAPSNC